MEKAQADPKKCGAGKGVDCCIFMTVGANGFECERFSALRNTLIFKKEQMVAKREPTELYPGCQIY